MYNRMQRNQEYMTYEDRWLDMMRYFFVPAMSAKWQIKILFRQVVPKVYNLASYKLGDWGRCETKRGA